jgi:hypothetical protein
MYSHIPSPGHFLFFGLPDVGRLIVLPARQLARSRDVLTASPVYADRCMKSLATCILQPKSHLASGIVSFATTILKLLRG